MVEKLQIILTKSFYYEGTYEVRHISHDQIELQCEGLCIRFTASNLTIQLMVEKELYLTFDELKGMELVQQQVGSKALLNGD